MQTGDGRIRYTRLLTLLSVFAVLLALHLFYLFLSSSSRFPINTIKISAHYQHIPRKQLEGLLEKYSNRSFFFLSTHRLAKELKSLDWTETVSVKRIWPDTLEITLVEKIPVALWNEAMLSEKGEIFNAERMEIDNYLPQLKGDSKQALQVLHVYQKMSKILMSYGLEARALEWRKNEAWELTLSDGVTLRLGKRDYLARMKRFCKAYPVISNGRSEQLASVDLRYPRGMAIEWK